MRITVAVAVACFSIVAATTGKDAEATMRIPTNIAAQGLAPALRTLAKERDVQMVYRAELVGDHQTSGAAGDLTFEEALTQLLNGTGLTYRYLENNAITIVPIPSGSSSTLSTSSQREGSSASRKGEDSTKGSDSGEGAQSNSFWGRFRLAQVDQGNSSRTNQTSDTSSSSPAQLEEIVVTASKREESLSKTPIAVSALTQQQLTNAGVVSVADLTSATPNVQIEQYPFTGSIYPAIRGIISRDFTETGDPDVPMYIDGVSIPRSYGLGSAFYDLERIEVLRGPQGTLYGKDATAGNINILTAPPERQFAAEADSGVGNYGDIRSHAMVNIPVSDTLAVRVSGVTHRNDGYFKTEGTTARNYGATDEYGGRISALWQPADSFKWRLTFDDFVSNDTEGLGIPTGANGQPLDGRAIYSRPVPSTPEPTQFIKNFIGRSRMDWQISRDLSLSYIVGLQRDSESYATAIPVSGTLFDPAAIGNVPAHGDFHNNNQYHEVNLRFDYHWIKNILGFNYADERTRSVYNNQFLPFDFNLAFNVPDARDSNRGVFDQATINVSDRMRLTAGIRESWDSKNVGNRVELLCPVNFLYTGGAIPAACAQAPWRGQGSWSAVTWKGGIDYDITDKIMSYLTISTGYKAGGINFAAPSPQLYYRPEHVKNYEIGIKGRYLDGRATLNADFFYEDYKDIDVNYWVCSAQVGCNFVTTNAARAAIWGPELDGSLKITNSDRLDGFLNYLHATYTDYLNAKDPLTNIAYPSLNGKFLPNAPEISARLQYAHDFLLPNGAKLTPMAAVYWQSESFLREFNLPVDRVPAYSKTSLRLTYASESDRWQVQAYVDNVEDHAVRVGYDAIIEAYNSWYAPPRTFGVTGTYRW
jgi:iron complex outermembrane receptor protein